MKYCAGCGKEIKYDAVQEGKVSYHPRCLNVVAKIEIDQHIKSVNANRIRCEMRLTKRGMNPHADSTLKEL